MPVEALDPQPQTQTPARELKQASSVLRGILLCGCFLTSLFVTAAVIGKFLPFPPVPGVQEKVEWLRQHGDEYDTLFIGSSRTNHHVIPELFDKLMAEAGVPTHSFNLGVDGMRSPEDSYLLQHVLATRKAPVKMVIVECNKIAVHSGDDAGIRGTVRIAYWHDLKRSLAVAKAIFAREKINKKKRWASYRKAVAETVPPLLYDAQLTINQTVNLGRGPEMVQRWLGISSPLAAEPLGPRHDGYPTPAKVAINDSEWNVIQSQVNSFMTKKVEPDFGDKPSQSELQQKREWVTAHHGQLVLYIPPLAGGFEFNPDPKSGPLIPILDFASPRRYPELFARPNRQDSGHLNAQGAEVFTRLLVQHLVREGGPLAQKSAAASDGHATSKQN